HASASPSCVSPAARSRSRSRTPNARAAWTRPSSSLSSRPDAVSLVVRFMQERSGGAADSYRSYSSYLALWCLYSAPASLPLTHPSATPVSGDTDWYYASGAEHRGPFSSTQMRGLLASGTIGPGTLVWHEGLEGWVEARAAFGLRRTPPPVPKEAGRSAAQVVPGVVDAPIPSGADDLVGPTRGAARPPGSGRLSGVALLRSVLGSFEGVTPPQWTIAALGAFEMLVVLTALAGSAGGSALVAFGLAALGTAGGLGLHRHPALCTRLATAAPGLLGLLMALVLVAAPAGDNAAVWLLLLVVVPHLALVLRFSKRSDEAEPHRAPSGEGVAPATTNAERPEAGAVLEGGERPGGEQPGGEQAGGVDAPGARATPGQSTAPVAGGGATGRQSAGAPARRGGLSRAEREERERRRRLVRRRAQVRGRLTLAALVVLGVVLGGFGVSAHLRHTAEAARRVQALQSGLDGYRPTAPATALP